MFLRDKGMGKEEEDTIEDTTTKCLRLHILYSRFPFFSECVTYNRGKISVDLGLKLCLDLL